MSESKQIRPRPATYPKVPPISLELTNLCNLKCPYCANNTLTRPSGYIDWKLLEKLVDECSGAPYGIDWLHGTGEPLLWDRLEEVITLVTSRGAGQASFATNGTLLYTDRVESLLAAGLKSIYISIDSLDEKIYKATRGGDVLKVIRNVQDMIAIVPPDFGITIALMDHKMQTITDTEIAKFRDTFGPEERVKLNIIATGLMPSVREDFRDYTRFPAKVDGCRTPSQYFWIALDGRVGLCCADQDLLHQIGDVKTQTIDEIWFSEKNQTLFRNIAFGLRECPDICTKQCHLNEPEIVPAFGEQFKLSHPATLGWLTHAFDEPGWSTPEAWGAWTVGPAAQLVLDLDAPSDRDLTLEMDVRHVAGITDTQSQEVAVAVNGEAIERWIFTASDEPGTRVAVIPAAVAAREPVLTLQLAVLRPTAPSAISSSPDGRPLGIGVGTVRVS